MGCILHLFDLAQPCVFVKQLPGPILCALLMTRTPFPKLRGQFAQFLNRESLNALVCSTRLRVSVYGTGAHGLMFSGFSREYALPSLSDSSLGRTPVLSGFGSHGGFAWMINTYTLSTHIPSGAAVSLLRLRIAPCGSNGILTVLPSPSPFGWALGPDWTPGWLTLPGKP